MRSVVRQGSVRCAGCLLLPRWCICAGQRPIACPVAVDVLMHHRERRRPSSSGRLLHRLLPESRLHPWHPGQPLEVGDIAIPGRERWILHPRGEPAPSGPGAESVQIVLLDGSWSEASAMAKHVVSWGRRVCLPAGEETRYWLRDPAAAGLVSTLEALTLVLRLLGLGAAGEALRAQLELHVYANLRMRGRNERAAEFLRDSPAQALLLEVLGAVEA